MFAYMVKAKRVLEVGMFVGYGSLTMAEVLPEDGEVVACDVDPFLKDWTKPLFDASPHGHKINVKIGPAVDTIRAWPEDQKFDMGEHRQSPIPVLPCAAPSRLRRPLAHDFRSNLALSLSLPGYPPPPNPSPPLVLVLFVPLRPCTTSVPGRGQRGLRGLL